MLDRLRRINAIARHDVEVLTESESLADQKTVAIREGILSFVDPFLIPNDSMSMLIMGMLRRMLDRANYYDLHNVVNNAREFVRFVDALDTSHDATNDGGTHDSDPNAIGGVDDGSRNPDRDDQVREINPIEANHSRILPTLPDDGASSLGGHETEMARIDNG
ncbi:MAG: hypothetical protein ACREHG_04300 [Candidatus Saccharimonadales bacterium]